MKKFALLLAVIMAVSLCGMLWADDEEREAPVYSPKIDPTLRYGTKGRTLEGDGNIIQPRNVQEGLSR